MPGTRRRNDAFMRRLLTALLLVLGSAGCRTSAPVSPVPVDDGEPPPDGETISRRGPDLVHIGGTIDVGTMTLEYYAVLSRGDDGEYSGTLDIPVQNTRGVALAGVEVDEDRVAFSLPAVGANWSGTIIGGERMACSFEQGGASLPCTMQRITAEQLAAATAPPKRPQHPQPPFPYDSEEVSYENAAAGVKLAGTLTLPRADGPFAVALLITGSGQQDRDETIMGHKPFLVMADHMTRRGIAVLRVDDRGVGGSTGTIEEATTEDFAGDVLAGVEFLSTHPRIDPRRIGLIGHSEGGLIAPMVATSSNRVAFVVMLAGPGVPGAELLVEQVGAVAQATGADATKVAEAKAKQREIIDVIIEVEDRKEAEARLQVLLRKDDPSGGTPGPQVGLQVLLSPWFRWFMKHDPRPVLRKVKCPVLVLNGELDTQVLAQQNVPEIEKALKAAGNRRVSVHRLPGLNHLFQTATTGGVDEYERIEETFSPAALDLIASWIDTEILAEH